MVLSFSGVAGITLSGAFKGWMGRKCSGMEKWPKALI